MDIEKVKQIRDKTSLGLNESKKLLEKYGTVEKSLVQWHLESQWMEEQKASRKYEDIDDLWVFKEKWCENIKESDKPFLKPLSDKYCAELWAEYVSEQHRHLMLVNDDAEWKIKEKVIQEYSWMPDWNNDNISAFQENIAPLLNWNTDEQVYFFWGRNSGLETQWKYLCCYWIAFLYDDEMNIVINPKSEKVLILGVHGYVATGTREV